MQVSIRIVSRLWNPRERVLPTHTGTDALGWGILCVYAGVTCDVWHWVMCDGDGTSGHANLSPASPREHGGGEGLFSVQLWWLRSWDGEKVGDSSILLLCVFYLNSFSLVANWIDLDYFLFWCFSQTIVSFWLQNSDTTINVDKESWSS